MIILTLKGNIACIEQLCQPEHERVIIDSIVQSPMTTLQDTHQHQF